MAQGNTQTLRTTNTYAMAVTALMTAVTCILAPLSIPIGPVPIFRIHRRNRKACRTNWRIYHWFHPNGNHCRYCN